MMSGDKLYIILISIHGLIRSKDLELGRDADTGGQTKYVVELARYLAAHKNVKQVDLLTRLVVDPSVDDDYQNNFEPISKNARIVRISAGPNEYLPKETLWDHLDNFTDNAMAYLRESEEIPNIIHAHYADAGFVGLRMSNLMGVPLAFTGHSLGRVKRQRLIANGVSRSEIESQYNITRRIEAEEDTLSVANFVVTSTNNEIQEQYELYDHYQPNKMEVIPPGVDLSRYRAAQQTQWNSKIAEKIKCFISDTSKPILLAISRADERKNISGLVHAYGESLELQEKSNLVIIAGNREDFRDLDSGAQTVIDELLYLIDLYDLYGKVAYPKTHTPDEVPIFYQLAVHTKGVFINPALTEPFGLTLLEAAATGLPIVATEDGGPIDIIKNCNNGLLINPLESNSIIDAVLKILSDEDLWQTMSENGLNGVNDYYTWGAHVNEYVNKISGMENLMEGPPVAPAIKTPIHFHERALCTDLDQTLLGDISALAEFSDLIKGKRKQTAFCIATGRRLNSALRVIKQYSIPHPDVLITSVGTEIHYGAKLIKDTSWDAHVDYMWSRERIRKLLVDQPGLFYQPKADQSVYKLSYKVDSKLAPSYEEITTLLHNVDLSANIVISLGLFLDITPIRASKGFALRYISDQWDIPLDRILVAGGSGADEDMLRGNTLSVVVANRHEEELSNLSEVEPMYFASAPYAAGVIEAINHYKFFG